MGSHKQAVPLCPPDVNVRGTIFQSTICLHCRILVPQLARVLYTVMGPKLWFLRVLNPWYVVTTGFHELFPLGMVLPGGTLKDLLDSRHTPPLGCEMVTLVSLDKQD